MTRKFLENWLKPLYLKDGYMTEERFAELSPEEWSDYKYGGEYLKTFYDIEDKDGNVHIGRYPNAGKFRVTINGKEEIIMVKDIIRFKLSDR